MKQLTLPTRQRGVALLVALSFLVIITLISVSAIRSSTSELRMASNFEDGMAAVQVAQSAIDSAINDMDNFVVSGVVGTVNSSVSIGTDISEFEHTHGGSTYVHTRVDVTEQATTVPPRGLGLSASKYQTTYFDMTSSYDNVGEGRGQASISQGVILLVQK